MIGKTILHYTITEEIGRGGMGIVYKAQDTKLKRTVALKFLPPAVGAEERARFETEAQSVAHLQHPNICGIHEINEFGGQTFIVMPFLDGIELKQRTATGPMDTAEAVMIALQVATALEEAHENGIIHRDIKSANIMITKKGLVKVMDFGLAKREGSAQITKSSTSLGTIDYMSPEQASGQPADHRADIWALGIVLYEMAAGKTPYEGTFEQAVIYSILNEDSPSLKSANPDVPDSLDRVVSRSLAKNPDERYQSMGEMIAGLREVQDEVGVPDGISGAVSTVTARPSTGSRMAAPATGSILSRLTQRRVPQVMVAYIAVAVAVILLLRWLVDRFPVSPNLPGFAMTAFALLLPAVFLAVYFRGRHAASKIGIPVYLAVAAALLVVASQKQDLGAATETVRITDEDGNTIERALPKGEFRKRFALFYLDNDTGDPDNDWLSYGLAQMLRYEFNQDTYLAYNLGFTRPHKEAGFDKPVGSPLTLKREFATQFHDPRFLAGSFTRDGDVYVVDITLYDTASGRPVAVRQFRNVDVFALVDEMSIQVRRDLGVPEYQIEENPDLPVADMFTNSLEAMEFYVGGVNSIWQDNDYAGGAQLLSRAVQLDPTFTSAHWELYSAQTALNNAAAAKESIRLALKHKYRLPESVRYNLMHAYYMSNQDYERILENAKRWAALYPEAAGAHEVLADEYERLTDFDAAIVERKILFEIDPGQYYQLHSIGSLYEKTGNDEEALQYYQQYAALHPDKYNSYTTIGSYYRRRGEYDNARDYYKKALLVDPERMFIRTSLAEIERHAGNFDASYAQCRDALDSARTPGDSVTALWQLVEYHSFRGAAREALDYQIAALEAMGRTTAPLQVTITRLFTLGIYVDAGRFDDALAIAHSIEETEGMPWMKPLVSAGYIIAYSTNEDTSYLPEVEKHVARFEAWMNATGAQELLWALKYCKGLETAWRGDNEKSLEYITAGLDVIPPDEVDNKLWMLTSAVQVARELEDYPAAERYLEQLFQLEPFSPEGHLEAALMYDARGQTDKAIEHLKKALEVWEHADTEHRRAKRARELSDKLRLSS